MGQKHTGFYVVGTPIDLGSFPLIQGAGFKGFEIPEGSIVYDSSDRASIISCRVGSRGYQNIKFYYDSEDKISTVEFIFPIGTVVSTFKPRYTGIPKYCSGILKE